MMAITHSFVRFSRGAFLALFATAAIAAEPFIAGPSVVPASETAAFSGGGFTPDATIQVRLSDPNGAQAVKTERVGQDGRLSFVVAASGSGAYTVAVTDLGGVVLASAAFISP